MISKGLKLVVFVMMLLVASNASAARRTTSVKVSTLNLKWFGIGGFLWNDPEDEFREENVKRFIEETMSDSDVIVFTEIVVVETLENILKDWMSCVTYDATWSRHQHVVICYNKEKFRAEKYDEDFVIQEVDLGSGGLRPAAHTKICFKNGSCFMQVIGIHLAAGNKTKKRSDQLQFVNDVLAKQRKMLPTVITGDWNSYDASQTKGSEDDIKIFERILSKGTRNFRTITENVDSYKGGARARTYDHIVVSSDVKAMKTWGYEACKDEPDFSKTFIPYYSLKRHYMDHCPVSAQIQVKR